MGTGFRNSDEIKIEARWVGCRRSKNMSDLTEAVYAGGRSGWAEADLVGLVKESSVLTRTHGP